ncbi:MAG: SurA N-terminal domain-containing protein [Elusimicrobia bacterium]|nr:SurA N-terminal domain-containing protein [Elusimicrobiota bacterium]
MRFIRKHKNFFLLLTLLSFFFSIFVGVGSYFFLAWDTRNVAAKVGKAKIGRQLFEMSYRQALEGMKADNPELEMTPEVEGNLKNNVLRELIIRELVTLEARAWGLRSTGREVAQDIASRPAFQTDGRFDPAKYYQFAMRTLGILPKELEAERSKDLTDMKFRALVSWSFPPSPSELQWLYHVYSPTRTAAAWAKEADAFSRRVQSEEALATLNQLLLQLSQKHPIESYLGQEQAAQ